jgi:two-component system nitrogen regulation response regulator GlnG
MADLHIFVISDDHELSQHVRSQFDRTATVTVLPGLRRRLPKLSSHGPHLFLVDALHATTPGLTKLLRAGSNGSTPYIVIGTAAQLIRSCDRLRAMALQLHHEPMAPSSEGPGKHDKLPHQAGLDLTLSDFMERKFNEFVRKIRLSGGKDLFHLLRHEFEKPLITLTLKETKGNQVQAAYLLGVNRNTLRKKIKELKITVKR